MTDCQRPDCAICRLKRHAESRYKMTKKQLIEDAEQGDEVYVNLSEEVEMYRIYDRTLSAHLRHDHGCDHDFTSVALGEDA